MNKKSAAEKRQERIEDMINNPTSTKNIKKYQDLKYENGEITNSQKTGKRLSKFLFIFTFSLLLTFIATTEFVQVSGNSMYPTFEDGELFFVKKLKTPARGEVVVFKQDLTSVGGKGVEILIKRVVAIPGDIVEIKNTEVLVNGEVVAASAATLDENNEMKLFEGNKTWELTEDEYFVIGDNRNNGASVDSRYFGPITKKQITGVLNSQGEKYTELNKNWNTLFV